MAAPATTDEFLELVRKSGVVEEKRLDPWLQKQRGAGLPDKPSEAAALLIRDGILTRFQAVQILQGKWRRFTIGKYKVLEQLGSGGMGSVYLCEHKLMRRRVAVKVLPTAKAQDESALARFYREARAVAALDHPNIVHAYDIDQDENLHFLVMEYVDGASLQEIIKKTGPMDIGRACHYIRQSALGLEHAHLSGLIHRDIKPGNILVERSGVVKILDMGLARFFNDEDDVLTKKFDENVLGTADYLAPEQAQDSHTVDIRADIYSLGATFYFLLTGRTIFGEGTVAQKLMWHMSRQPKTVNEFRPEVPAGIAMILGKMLAKEPADRYQAPGDVAAALEPYTQTPVGPPSEAEMPQLSLAAGGQAPSIETVDTAVVKREESTPGQSTVPKALQGMSTKSPAKPTSAPPRSPRPTPRPATASATPAPAPPKPAAAPAPAVQTLTPPGESSTDERAPWENLESVDTEDPSAKADTARQGSTSARRMVMPAILKNKRQAWLIFSSLAGVGAMVLIIGLVSVLLSRSGPAVVARQPLEVTSDAGRANTYRTVSQALRAARAGDVIYLTDAEHRENLIVEPKLNVAMDVTVQPAPGKEVVWKSARIKDEKAPLVTLQHAANFKIKDVTFDGTLEGSKRVNDLIVLNFHAPGLTIDGVTLRGFARSGINVMNLWGSKERPVRLANLSAISVAPESPQGALLFDANPDSTPQFNDFIEVSEVHAQGLKTVIKKKDNTVVGKNIVWPK
jgi:serine/threonine protein kinase